MRRSFLPREQQFVILASKEGRPQKQEQRVQTQTKINVYSGLIKLENSEKVLAGRFFFSETVANCRVDVAVFPELTEEGFLFAGEDIAADLRFPVVGEIVGHFGSEIGIVL